jgi:hypothetical protein
LFLKVFVNRFAYLALLVLPSGGVYVLAGKTKCAAECFLDGRAETSIFFRAGGEFLKPSRVA